MCLLLCLTWLPFISDSTGQFAGKADLAELPSLYELAVEHAYATQGVYRNPEPADTQSRLELKHAVDDAVKTVGMYVAQFVCRSVMMFWARRGRTSLTDMLCILCVGASSCFGQREAERVWHICYAFCVQERHDVLGKERQSEFDRASAAEVARAAMEVQLTAHQERGAHLTTQLQESGVQIQVKMVFFKRLIAVVVM